MYLYEKNDFSKKKLCFPFFWFDCPALADRNKQKATNVNRKHFFHEDSGLLEKQFVSLPKLHFYCTAHFACRNNIT
jgi:hypothetical protein